MGRLAALDRAWHHCGAGRRCSWRPVQYKAAGADRKGARSVHADCVQIAGRTEASELLQVGPAKHTHEGMFARAPCARGCVQA